MVLLSFIIHIEEGTIATQNSFQKYKLIKAMFIQNINFCLLVMRYKYYYTQSDKYAKWIQLCSFKVGHLFFSHSHYRKVFTDLTCTLLSTTYFQHISDSFNLTIWLSTYTLYSMWLFRVLNTLAITTPAELN